MDSQIDIHFRKNLFKENEVIVKVNKFPLKEHWKIEEHPKEFIAKFKPPREKILKQFRQIN